MITEIRGECTDADGNPVITSVVTMIGEAKPDDDADAVVSTIAARRDAALKSFVAGGTASAQESVAPAGQ